MTNKQFTNLKGTLLAIHLVFWPGAAMAQGAQSEIPIRQVVLSNGVRRYAVPIRVGSTELLAGLDTGSVGLRIISSALKQGDDRTSSHHDVASFGAGTKLSGLIATAVVSVGHLRRRTTIQLVQEVGCNSINPGCAAGRIPPKDYGILGDALPGEGFKAILGVNMAHAEIPSLFKGVGAQRWIIDLPRPGERRGRIVLNPTDAQAAGFLNLSIIPSYSRTILGFHDAVPGCLVNKHTQEQICGSVVFDTGKTGILVLSHKVRDHVWTKNTSTQLQFSNGSASAKVRENLVSGKRASKSALTFWPHDLGPRPVILAGAIAYLGLSVLYDPSRGTVGFRPRR